MTSFSTIFAGFLLFAVATAVPTEIPSDLHISSRQRGGGGGGGGGGPPGRNGPAAATPAAATPAAATPAAATPAAATPAACGDYDAVRVTILNNARTNEEWPARLLRAGFHDCLPQSCDGSLRLELGRDANDRLDDAIEMLTSSIAGTCVSLADAIKMGIEISMELSGGPTVTCPMGTVDATTANPDNQLPDRNDPLETLVRTFTAKGFSTRHAVSSVVGGHSLGRSGNNPFTPTQDVFNNNFASFLILESNGGTSAGFNSIASDRAYMNDADTLALVTEYAGSDAVLRTDFQSFLQQLCNM